MRLRLLFGFLFCALAVATGLGATVAVDRMFFSSDPSSLCSFERTPSERPELQRVLDDVVARSSLAPGATAYVIGPRGRWAGSAGVAETSGCVRMPVDARMRLESVSKIYTATLILQLEQEGRLRVTDTVARWLPGLLPYGNRITVRQLLTMSSGLIDNNDFANASESRVRTYITNVKDLALRSELLATAARVDEDPATTFPEALWIRWAAWQPLLFTPGYGYHYSNIGYDILGAIAVRASGKPLRLLYSERLFQPLNLDHTAYDPQGTIDGLHAHGYAIEPNGSQSDSTSWHAGVGAEGGVVSNAADTAWFLHGLMRGRLVDPAYVDRMKVGDLWPGGQPSGCAGQAYGWSGGGSGFKTDVWVNGDGSRIAVLLLNARHMGDAQPAADQAAHDALVRLYCAA